MDICIRAETYSNEHRSPLVPKDVSRLVKKGYRILVEKSEARAFSDDEFQYAGAELTDVKWFDQKPASRILIIGLKELDHIELLNRHSHVYFSHSFKKQIGAERVLSAFKNSESSLYDLESFRDEKGVRTLAFGFYAGMVGAILGLKQNYNRKLGLEDIANLKPWSSLDEMHEFGRRCISYAAIVGNGRCSKGVQTILKRFGMGYDVIEKDQTVVPCVYDIIFNCISLDDSYNKIWISPEYEHKKSLLVVDISCDYTKANNPIAIYKEATTWAEPVFNYNKYISVIAIEDLPSLLPRESSTEFSGLLTNLILRYGDEEWNRCLEEFSEAAKL